MGSTDEAARRVRRRGHHRRDRAVLRARGHAVERIGARGSAGRAARMGERWELVFNFCEGLRGAGREALVPALLDAYAIPFVFCDRSRWRSRCTRACQARGARRGLADRRFRGARRAPRRASAVARLPALRETRWRGHGQRHRRGEPLPFRRGTRRVAARLHRAFRAARAGGRVPARPRIHRRHARHRRSGACASG